MCLSCEHGPECGHEITERHQHQLQVSSDVGCGGRCSSTGWGRALPRTSPSRHFPCLFLPNEICAGAPSLPLLSSPVLSSPSRLSVICRCVYNHMSDSDVCCSGRYSATIPLGATSQESQRETSLAAPAAVAIRSVHFTQACPKPWLCAPVSDIYQFCVFIPSIIES